MGNRILKESILTSKNLSELTWFEQVLFDHLIVSVDDYGVYFADPTLLARALFPRRGDVTAKMLGDGLDRMEELGLILRYTAGGERFLKLVTWEKHQRLRASRKQFPLPEDAEGGEGPAEAEKEPAGEAPAEAEEEPAVETRAEPAPETPEEPPVIGIPLNDRTDYAVTRTEADEFAGLYPAVDVMQELRKMRGWCLANPDKRKTRRGVRKFINGWLAREQDKGGSRPPPGDNPFLRMAREGAGNAGKEDAP